MENASKALIIAAEVLIAILLLTLFAYIFTSMSESRENLDNQMQAAKITNYNQPFLNYNGRGEELTDIDKNGSQIAHPLNIQDIATIMNISIDSNKRHEFDNIITVMLDNTSLVDETTDYDATEKFLNDNYTSTAGYKCEVEINPETQLVNIIKITTIT